MHGRVKIIRTAEQEKLIAEKRYMKDKEFRLACEKLWSNRINKQFNDEQLCQTTHLLQISPDTVTFWNYRREILQNLFSKLKSDSDNHISLLNSELNLTAHCLAESPKVYAAWHHRCWVMQNHIAPDWLSEINFCNQALKIDERNFHCWDYRRFVVSKGNVSTESELKYTDVVIENNFSNFSAWHYRSELLSSSTNVLGILSPLSPPPEFTSKIEGKKPSIDFSLPCDELDLVHNALYTDPSDQSPWFYFWWLLGHGERKSYLRELYLSRDLEKLILVFTAVKPINTLNELDVSIKVYPSVGSIDDAIILTPSMLGGWFPVLEGGLSAVWYLPLSQNLVSYYMPESQKALYQSNHWNVVASVCVRNFDKTNKIKTCKDQECPPDHSFCLHCIMDSSQNESLTRVSLDPIRLLNPMILPTNDPEDLIGELEIIRDLYVMEPENKWILLTLVSFLRFIRPEGYESEVTQALEKLSVIDFQRIAYYEDLHSFHVAQDALVAVFNTNSRVIKLNNLNIKNLHYLDWFTLMTNIDISNNCITHLPDLFVYLLCLQDLNLDDNKLVNLKGISRLPLLSHLSVQRNQLTNFESIEDLLYSSSLRIVYINGNKVVELADLTQKLSEHHGIQGQGPSLSIVYDKVIRS